MTSTARLLLVLALVLRVAVAVWAYDLELVLDEIDYARRAQYILENGHLPDAFRPPVYPMMLAAVFGVVGVEPGAVRVLQALLGTATAAVLARWLHSHVGERGMLLSLALFAVYPTLVGFSHFLFTETLYLGLLVLALVFAFPARRDPVPRPAALGAVLATAGLTRSLMVPLLPVVAVCVGLLTRSWRRAGAMLGVAVLCLLPWMGHNLVVTGSPTVLEISNGVNLWKGNTTVVHPMATEGPQFPGPIVSIPMFPYAGSKATLEDLCTERLGLETTPAFEEVNACARSLALETILADPVGFVGRMPRKLLHLFHPSSQVTRSLWLGSYGGVPGWAGTGLIWATALSWAVVVVLGAWGLRRMPRDGLRWALLLLVAHQVAVVAVTFGHSRFRLPIVLVCIVAAAWVPRPGQLRPRD